MGKRASWKIQPLPINPFQGIGIGILVSFCSSCFLLLPKHLIQSFKYSSVAFKNISSTFCFLPLSVSHDQAISEGKALPWYICISFHCVSKSFPPMRRREIARVTSHAYCYKPPVPEGLQTQNNIKLSPLSFFRCHMPSEPSSPVSSRSWCDIL